MFRYLNKFLYKFSKKQYYDMYVPFGRGCHSAMMMDRYGLRKCSYPFDWIIPSGNEFKNNTQAKFDLLFDFGDFFDKKNIKTNRQIDSGGGCYMMCNTKYNFTLWHDFKIKKSDEENLAEVSSKYLKRYKRLLGHIEQASRVCFIYMQNTWDHKNENFSLETDCIKANLIKLQEKYPQKTFDFLIFNHTPGFKRWQIEKNVMNAGSSKIVVYNSNHSKKANKKEKLSDIVSIKLILKTYKLTDKYKSFKEER